MGWEPGAASLFICFRLAALFCGGLASALPPDGRWRQRCFKPTLFTELSHLPFTPTFVSLPVALASTVELLLRLFMTK
jgi:hypothetical protein